VFYSSEFLLFVPNVAHFDAGTLKLQRIIKWDVFETRCISKSKPQSTTSISKVFLQVGPDYPCAILPRLKSKKEHCMQIAQWNIDGQLYRIKPETNLMNIQMSRDTLHLYKVVHKVKSALKHN